MTHVANATPYPWPYDGVLEPQQIALIVCGAGTAWAARTPLDSAIEDRVSELRGWARHVGVAVVLLDEAPPLVHGTATFPTPSSAPLTPTPHESMLPAAGTDGFYGSSLDAKLHQGGVTHLLVAGRGFETCVHSTLRRANDRGYECLTIADACTPIDPANRAASVSSIEMSGGIFGAVGMTEHVCAAISTQPHPQLPASPTASPVPTQHLETP